MTSEPAGEDPPRGLGVLWHVAVAIAFATAVLSFLWAAALVSRDPWPAIPWWLGTPYVAGGAVVLVILPAGVRYARLRDRTSLRLLLLGATCLSALALEWLVLRLSSLPPYC